MYSLYQKHCKRLDYIKSKLPDCNIIQKWECEFEDDKKNDNNLQQFLKNICNISDSINPRNALYGGRTNALKLYKKCNNTEKIHYVDYCS
jgi:hypothetical protein